MAPPRVGAGVVAALLLAGRAADVAAQSHGSQPPSASLEEDLAILLAFQAVGANSQDWYVGTWAAGGGPVEYVHGRAARLCDEASFDNVGGEFDAYNAGWKGVMCCASYDSHGFRCTGGNARRVTFLDLSVSPTVSGDIGPLGRLAELQTLDLQNIAVAGDVAALANLGQLQSLYLSHTAVWGDVATLATLGQLQYLGLHDTAVWGRADALRAIPGLGADWRWFTACAAGGTSYDTADDFGQCPAGRSPVADGASYLGADECACCSGSLKMRNTTTGACVDPPGESPPAARNAPIHTRAWQNYLRASPHSVPGLPHFTAQDKCCIFSLRLFQLLCPSRLLEESVS